VQECVNNIVKHSRATKASVAIHRDEKTVTLKIADNGRGFDIEGGTARGADQQAKGVQKM